MKQAQEIPVGIGEGERGRVRDIGPPAFDERGIRPYFQIPPVNYQEGG